MQAAQVAQQDEWLGGPAEQKKKDPTFDVKSLK
jgi:hypothetical protein